MQRLVTAAILAPLLWAAIKVAPPTVFHVVATLAIVGACWECYRMMRGCGATPIAWLGLVAAAFVVWSYSGLPPSISASEPLVALVLVAVPTAMWSRPTTEAVMKTLVQTVFPVVFTALTMGYVVALRAVPDPDGSDLVTLLFICLILGDTAAYYVGKNLGRRKLAPQISPNKTWEGFIGAMFGAMLGALVAHFWFYQRLPLVHVVPIGLVLGLTGALGDLSESVVKRACGVKDSSGLVPGHGGIFDRMDNLLIATPVLYYYFRFFLTGTVS
jgi:phosphatidate cytidylyltransferase